VACILKIIVLKYLAGGDLMGNPFVHIELHTRDLRKSKKFYSDLFDWKMEDIPGQDYTVINVGEGTGGGLMVNPNSDAPDRWLPYILVDDVSAAARRAVSLGATLTQDRTEVPDMGWYSVLVDPFGLAFGLWQPKMTS
jgi:uncharacterized protein